MKKYRENRKVEKVVLDVKQRGEVGYNSVGIIIRKIQYTNKFLDSVWELFVKTLPFLIAPNFQIRKWCLKQMML